MARRLTIQKICRSFAVFFLIWSVRIACLSGFLEHMDSVLFREITAELIKGVIWLGFAFYMIREYHTELWLKPGKLLFHPITPRALILPSVLFLLYFLAGAFLYRGGLSLNPEFQPSMLIGTFLTVGVFEEFLFRGWFYNACASVMERSFANLVSAGFFVVIHYPGWIYAGISFGSILYKSAGIYVLGLIFGWALRRSRSIWPPVFLHMLWNLLSITLG